MQSPLVLLRAALWIAASLVVSLFFASADAPRVVRFCISNAGVGKPPRVGLGWLAVAQSRHVVEDELQTGGIQVEFIRRKFDVDSWIEDRFVEAVVKGLKLKNFWARFDSQGGAAPQP